MDARLKHLPYHSEGFRRRSERGDSDEWNCRMDIDRNASPEGLPPASER